jgi:histidinol phosphatase-like PHP family hydrolase
LPRGEGQRDVNAEIAAWLFDMAALQTSARSRWGYQRAAGTVLALDAPLDTLVRPDGSLPKLAQIGPSSTRVILEALETGRSRTVDAAIANSTRAADVGRSRGARRHFLSRARVLRVLHDRRLEGPTLEDYRGDLQAHSAWSDGTDTLADLVKACLRREYGFLAVTDHSHGLPVARGMSVASMRRQHREIAALNRRYGRRFRLLKGIEANILADGSLDLTPDDLRALDIVVAAPHAGLRLPTDQTARMVAAVRAPGVHILGHPRGRKFGARAGIVANWNAVFAEAARRRVAIEIDGDPARQDIDFALAGDALSAGCLFALNSDAHSAAELQYAETAIGHARLAGIPTVRIVNCWKLDRLLDWAEERRARLSV